MLINDRRHLGGVHALRRRGVRAAVAGRAAPRERAASAPAAASKRDYLALLDQIGEEAMRRANKAIEELKKRPSK